MIDVATILKEKGAKRVYLISTFAFLTEGPDRFIKAYEDNLFDKLYATNLLYVADIIKNQKWYEEVDCSSLIADIILTLNNKKSLENFF